MPSKEQVVAFIRKHGIHRLVQLKKLNTDEVREYDLIKYFGSWREGMLSIWGLPDWQKNMSAEYVLKCVIEFKIRNKSGYLKAARKFPDIIPPEKEVLFCWGSFKNLFECAKRKDLSGMIREYAKYVIKNGGVFPTPAKLLSEGIRIGECVTLFGGKDKFDEFVSELISGRII